MSWGPNLANMSSPSACAHDTGCHRLILAILLSITCFMVYTRWIPATLTASTLPQKAWQYRYVNPDTREHGQPMSEEAGRVYKSLNISENDYMNDLTIDAADEFVFVTGTTSNHFKESEDAVGSIQLAFPNRTILHYDLGLLAAQRKTIQSWCNVKLVGFDYKRYPAHVQNLHTYAFKFLVIADALQSYPGVFWFDASARFSAYNLTKVYKKAVTTRGFLMFKGAHHGIYATTDPRMYAYLPTDLQQLKRRMCLTSGTVLVLRTPLTLAHIVRPALLCSLDPRCIAPTDQLFCEARLLATWDTYIGCHRYDQSMINILALNVYRYHQTAFLYESPLVTYKRRTTNNFQVQVCG